MNDAFRAGYEAYYTGKDDTDNPYEVTDDDHLSWNDGYSEAEDDSDSEEDE